MEAELANSLVERLLFACGGGRVLVIGATSGSVLRAFRRRAVDAISGSLDSLTVAASPDLIVITDGLDQLPSPDLPSTLEQLRRLNPRALAVRVPSGRQQWETQFIDRQWRRHPLYQALLPLEASAHNPIDLLLQPVPQQVRTGQSLREIRRAQDLRTDMLRDSGPGADARVARYEFARTLIRPGDRVLDASCGLGCGSALLAEGSLADCVLGVDLEQSAIDYANEHYGRRPRLKFARRDLSALSADARSTFDVIVCFDTIELLANPAPFLAECQRLLTPGGRFVGSIATGASGVASDDHQLHTFTLPAFEQLCRKYFEIELVRGQTAASLAPSTTIWKNDGRDRRADNWIVVGLTDPFLSRHLEFRHGLMPPGIDAPGNLLAYERDYDRPWLLRAMISMGFKTDGASTLERMATRSAQASQPGSADKGAALCARAYLHMDRCGGIDADLIAQIEDYCREAASSPSAFRWQVSLRFAQALAFLDAGDQPRAIRALEQCATSDPLVYNPLLATKTVSAAWLLGWIALQMGDLDRARSWWTSGVAAAERALQRPWEELMVSWSSPVLFGLRDAALIVDLASQCATGLHLLPHAADRPGLVAAQLADSMGGQLDRFRREERLRRAPLAAATLPAGAPRLESRPLPRATALLKSPSQQVPSGLRLAIFGVGNYGQDALHRLRQRGANVACFSDLNSTHWYDKLEGLPVVAPAALRARKIDLIAVACLEAKEAAFAQLERLGYEPGRDFDTVA